MWGINKKIDYGLELMLALAKSDGNKPTPLRQIARQRRLPYAFLAQLALVLKKAGLIKGKEGAKGGYYLACPPDQITVTRALSVLENFKEQDCRQCRRLGFCRPHQIWQEVDNAVRRETDKKTLADLARTIA